MKWRPFSTEGLNEHDDEVDKVIHKIRQWVVDDKVIDLVKIGMKKNPTDMMTKTIPVEKFRAFLNFIMVLQK